MPAMGSRFGCAAQPQAHRPHNDQNWAPYSRSSDCLTFHRGTPILMSCVPIAEGARLSVDTKTCYVGLVGFGTVGGGVAKILLTDAGKLRAKTGIQIVLRRICDVDLTRDRGVRVPEGVLTNDLDAVLKDPEIEVVVELVGGTTVAKEITLRAIAAGKRVVTANKALLAEHGRELFRAARERGVSISFEASVGGGIPIIAALRDGLIANDIESIMGIVNGTCNYILTRMSVAGATYEQALAEAQSHGYAERDPRFDVEGIDSAHKLAILAALGFAADFHYPDIYVEGITRLEPIDIAFAAEFGYALKLLAIGKRVNAELELRVHPTLLPNEHPLAAVHDVFNGIFVRGSAVGDTMFYGRGAGQMPTASAIVSDIVDILLGKAKHTFERLRLFPGRTESLRVRSIEESESRYYLRFAAVDRPGVLAKIAGEFGRHDISIASVLQKER
ncbi:MAG: homoserine dehydrogenase, partial [Planctomycetes bacterium]|nr:homoserine dehydrogenase [Planctomycetota bacterium]